MEGHVNVYGDITEQTAGKAEAILLERLQGLVTWERFISQDPLGKNKTRTKTWRRYNPFPDIVAPLAEGVTPPGQELTFTDYHATLEQWGGSTVLTDVIQDTHTDPILKEMFKLVGEQAAKTIEFTRQNTFQGGTNVYYANGVASRAVVNSPATRGDFRKISRQFARNNIEKISEIIKASRFISTQPIEAAYFGIGHTDTSSDLRGLTGFIPVADYANSSDAMKGEIGSFEDFRIILTSLAKSWEVSGLTGTTYLAYGATPAATTQCDVYPLCLFGQNFGAGVPLQGYQTVTPMVLNPNTPRGGDELGQRGSVGWKTYGANALLCQSALARLEVAVTANPS